MLRSRLDTIARTLDEEIDSGIRNAAEEIAVGAKQRVPVETGALRDAIHVERVSEGAYSVIAGSTKAFYGHIVEHGGVNIPARPFLTPAYESVRGHIDDLVRDALRDL